MDKFTGDEKEKRIFFWLKCATESNSKTFFEVLLHLVKSEHLFVGLLCGNKILRQRIAISQVTTCSLSENGRRNLFWSSSPPRNFSSPHKTKTCMWKVLKGQAIRHAEKCHQFRNLCAYKREYKFFLSLF